MKINKTSIKNIFTITPNLFKDKRGKFLRYYCKNELRKKNIKFANVQSNLSYNISKYTLRGLHMQKKPYEEDKIITCMQGKLFFVAVDLRKKSKTFMKNYSCFLDDKKNSSIFVPKGCATGWLTLQPKTIINYLMSEYYKPSYSYNYYYKDPRFNIQWPNEPKVISKKDNNKKLINRKII